MTVGVFGLGLIGGSLARAYKKYGNSTVLAYDIDSSVTNIAMISGVVDSALTDENMSQCDLILIALYPKACVECLEHIAPLVRKDALVIDCCGIKREVCKTGFQVAKEHGFTYAGGHPMAGTHKSGFANSRADMFKGASMVVVPGEFDDIMLLERIKQALLPAGFGGISVTTAESHDELISFTSQLAHVVSNAYVKSPTAMKHKGFSAGSYKDLTRVAWLNPDMWAPLFMENRDNLIFEVNGIISELIKYRDAMESGDTETLRTLLDDGRRLKEEIDGE